MKQVNRFDAISIGPEDFEGTIDQVKDVLEEVVVRAKDAGMVGEGRFEIRVSEEHWDYFGVDIIYSFERTETNAERAAREMIEAKAKKDAAARKKKKKDAEYAQYLRLKKKFGDVEE